MGLGATEIILLIIALGIWMIPAVWGYIEGTKRTIGGGVGLILGLFLSFLGVIIVYCTKRTDTTPSNKFVYPSSADELHKYKKLLESGAITQQEYDLHKAKLLNSL